MQKGKSSLLTVDLENEGRLPRKFYERNSVEVAREMVGMHLVRRIDMTETVGMIVEAEAYGGGDDPASYAFKATPKSLPMFGRAGHAYIVSIHGHNCFNATTEKPGIPGAVLVRAVEPVRGIGRMKRNRRAKNLQNLSNGPGKLTQAMDITRDLNGLDLTESKKLFVRMPNLAIESSMVSARRIGVKDERLWRFYLKGSKFVSRR